MNNEDNKRYNERFQAMLETISKELPDCEVSATTFRGEIEVSRPSTRRSPYVKFVPADEFMEDEDVAFETILREGIRLAKEILDSPPIPERKYQGDIVLSHQGGSVFKKRK